MSENKVISIFSARKKKEKSKEQELLENIFCEPEEVESDLTFEEITKRNLANLERIRKERLNKNKSVLRTYGIKR